MTDLSQATQNLLARARAADTSSPSDAALIGRVRGALDRSLAPGRSVRSAAGKAGSPWFAKGAGRTIIVAMVSALLGAAGGWMAGRASREPRVEIATVRANHPAPLTIRETPPLHVVAITEPSGIVPTSTPVASNVPREVRVGPAGVPSRTAAPRDTTVAAGVPLPPSDHAVNVDDQSAIAPPATTDADAGDGLALEMRLITSAETALRAADPAAALSFTDEHARAFPNGMLAEERSAVRIIALCQLGRAADGRSESARFLNNAPRSPYAARVRSACQNEIEARDE